MPEAMDGSCTMCGFPYNSVSFFMFGFSSRIETVEIKLFGVYILSVTNLLVEVEVHDMIYFFS